MLRRCATLAVVLALLTPGLHADPSLEQQKLNGTWEITALIDNGELVSQSRIKETLALDAQLTVNGHILSLVRPVSLQKRDLPFVVNPSASPKTIEIAGSDKTGGKGTYLLDGDTLVVCLNGPDAKDRPAAFGSPAGSQTLLMTLKRVRPVTTAPAAPVGAAVPAPPKLSDDNTRKLLLGTWGHQDNEKVEMMTLNADGSFSSTRTWKKGFQQVFHEDVRSSGTWTLDNGVIIARITASTESDRINQVYSFRIRSLTATEVIYVDQDGKTRFEWKVR